MVRSEIETWRNSKNDGEGKKKFQGKFSARIIKRNKMNIEE